MKSASRVMFIIGKIFNIIGIIVSALFVVLGVLYIVFAQQIAENPIVSDFLHDPVLVRNIGINICIFAGLALVVSIIVLIFARKASNNLEADDTNSGPYIAMVVIGVFGYPFYLLGGLFGIIDAALQENQQKQ